jgi:hypothetical protein
VAHDAAEAPERGAPAGLVVVGELIEVPLDQERRAQARDEAALARSERAVDVPAPFFSSQRL